MQSKSNDTNIRNRLVFISVFYNCYYLLQFTSDMRGITDESDLSLVNYSIMSDRPGNNQSVSMLTQSPRKSNNTSFPEQPRSHSFRTSPKQVSIASQKLMTSPSASRTMTSYGQPVDSFSHLSATHSDEHSQSLLSFEKHEDSLLSTSEYSLLQSLPKKKKEKFAVLSIPVSKRPPKRRFFFFSILFFFCFFFFFLEKFCAPFPDAVDCWIQCKLSHIKACAAMRVECKIAIFLHLYASFTLSDCDATIAKYRIGSVAE